MKPLGIILFLTSLVVTSPLSVFPLPVAHAATQFRCNGVVQYRPCGQEIATGRSKKAKKLGTVAVAAKPVEVPRFDVSPVALSRGSRPYAEILKQTMLLLGKSLGQWRGSLRGNGDIHLQLHWFRDGVFSTSRSMGNVKLVHKVTSFAFRTSLPRGRGWTWKIVAHATPLS